MSAKLRGMIVATTISGAIALGAGCQSKGEPPTVAEAALESGVARDTRVFTPEHTDMIIVPGEVFVIQLPTNPSTGNRWRLSNNNPPLLDVLDARMVVDQSPPTATRPLLGRGGHEFWTFKAQGVCITQISFESQSPGANNVVDRKLFQVRIR